MDSIEDMDLIGTSRLLKNLGFDSYMVTDSDLKPDQLRLLTVDNPLYLPINTDIRVLITSEDVIHS